MYNIYTLSVHPGDTGHGTTPGAPRRHCSTVPMRLVDLHQTACRKWPVLRSGSTTTGVTPGIHGFDDALIEVKQMRACAAIDSVYTGENIAVLMGWDAARCRTGQPGPWRRHRKALLRRLLEYQFEVLLVMLQLIHHHFRLVHRFGQDEGTLDDHHELIRQ